jgi:RNA polymerase-binding transcription factor DksA
MGADPLDNAADLQASENESALQAQLSQNKFHIKSLTHCTDCGFEIEHKRQALGGVKRCTECEIDHQRELFQKKQRAM